MFSHTIKALFLIVSVMFLWGCGSSKRDLMTFLKKESLKMEWVKVCGDIPDNDLPGEGAGVCWTKYERVGQHSGKVVMFAGVRMSDNINDQVIVFAVPRGVDQDRGMRVKFDNEEPVGLRYSHCNETSCFAQMPLTNNTLIKLKYSKRMVVAVMNRYNKAYGYRVPMYRFVYAYNNPPKESHRGIRTASR